MKIYIDSYLKFDKHWRTEGHMKFLDKHSIIYDKGGIVEQKCYFEDSRVGEKALSVIYTAVREVDVEDCYLPLGLNDHLRIHLS